MMFNLGYAIYRFIARREENGPSEKDDKEEEEWSPRRATLDIFVNVSAIVYVEVSLKWNDIQGVHSLNSPGQFMPFVIALGQLFSVFFTASKAIMQTAADEHAFDPEDGESLLAAQCGPWEILLPPPRPTPPKTRVIVKHIN